MLAAHPKIKDYWRNKPYYLKLETTGRMKTVI